MDVHKQAQKLRDIQSHHRQLLANKKIVWKCNLPKEQLYWKLKGLLKHCHVLDKDTDNYSPEHLASMNRLYVWARKVYPEVF